MDFLESCDNHRILLAHFLSRAIHTVQPLDVVMFKSLSSQYSQELDAYILRGWGLLSMPKGDLFAMFWNVWVNSFKETLHTSYHRNLENAVAKQCKMPLNYHAAEQQMLTTALHLDTMQRFHLPQCPKSRSGVKRRLPTIPTRPNLIAENVYFWSQPSKLETFSGSRRSSQVLHMILLRRASSRYP